MKREDREKEKIETIQRPRETTKKGRARKREKRENRDRITDQTDRRPPLPHDLDGHVRTDMYTYSSHCRAGAVEKNCVIF